MFEKSLYDLIRGLRNHKGTEREYIQGSLKECRTEIKSQDMDIKATALLKLIYLEMYGHDMSWASFHILEVMSSVKYAQKRVGYLGAVQSLRSDTEVLMLATNLLKKDLTSPLLPTLSLPLVTLPHIINPSLAIALVTDLLPRLTHSHAAVRKKTIVTLYRFALVYPEALRPAWPKIKERLMDEKEDPSVTAAIVNVVCELGWRRPQDFLPLAPRLFDLLVEGGNNWMAIKIVKLFATLTPLEPRLVRKLLPPLTSLIRTTPAMSLLYECINGIIQGGILENTEETAEWEDIARLCVGKLRGMIAVEGDPNLKYVALLAFQRIVRSHPHLVSLHQDVILACIDDADISIRLRALDLLVNMVDSTNLTAIVGRLMRQLRNSPIASDADDSSHDRNTQPGVVPAADSDNEDPEESLKPVERTSRQPPPLSEEYRVAIIKRVLEMCSRETYVNITDFPWYIHVLVQLVQLAPIPTISAAWDETLPEGTEETARDTDVTHEIGLELLNIAVRVKDMRPEATQAAESLLLERGEHPAATSGADCRGYIKSAAWIVGEYADHLKRPSDVLSSLINTTVISFPAETIVIVVQAVPKVFTVLSGRSQTRWDPESKSMTSLLIARIVHFLEGLCSHPDLEVQERSVEFAELMRLAAEAASAQPTSKEQADEFEASPVITQVIPSLFAGLELNPVAPLAQKRVPVPEYLDLEAPINKALPDLLRSSWVSPDDDVEMDESTRFYYERPKVPVVAEAEPAANRLDQARAEALSYQYQSSMDSTEVISRRRAERREKNKDDPFYIPTETESPSSTPIHNILRNSNGIEVDIDSIPIMDLDIASKDKPLEVGPYRASSGRKEPQRRKPVEITGDETISTLDPNMADDQSNLENRDADMHQATRGARFKAKKSLLQVDSSGIEAFSLDSTEQTFGDPIQPRGKDEEDEEMARALKEVERVRLEMQRAAERIQLAEGVPPEGTLIKKKTKKKKSALDTERGLKKKSKKKEKTVVVSPEMEQKEGEANLEAEESRNPQEQDSFSQQPPDAPAL